MAFDTKDIDVIARMATPEDNNNIAALLTEALTNDIDYQQLIASDIISGEKLAYVIYENSTLSALIVYSFTESGGIEISDVIYSPFCDAAEIEDTSHNAFISFANDMLGIEKEVLFPTQTLDDISEIDYNGSLINDSYDLGSDGFEEIIDDQDDYITYEVLNSGLYVQGLEEPEKFIEDENIPYYDGQNEETSIQDVNNNIINTNVIPIIEESEEYEDLGEHKEYDGSEKHSKENSSQIETSENEKPQDIDHTTQLLQHIDELLHIDSTSQENPLGSSDAFKKIVDTAAKAGERIQSAEDEYTVVSVSDGTGNISVTHKNASDFTIVDEFDSVSDDDDFTPYEAFFEDNSLNDNEYLEETNEELTPLEVESENNDAVYSEYQAEENQYGFDQEYSEEPYMEQDQYGNEVLYKDSEYVVGDFAEDDNVDYEEQQLIEVMTGTDDFGNPIYEQVPIEQTTSVMTGTDDFGNPIYESILTSDVTDDMILEDTYQEQYQEQYQNYQDQDEFYQSDFGYNTAPAGYLGDANDEFSAYNDTTYYDNRTNLLESYDDNLPVLYAQDNAFTEAATIDEDTKPTYSMNFVDDFELPDPDEIDEASDEEENSRELQARNFDSVFPGSNDKKSRFSKNKSSSKKKRKGLVSKVIMTTILVIALSVGTGSAYVLLTREQNTENTNESKSALPEKTPEVILNEENKVSVSVDETATADTISQALYEAGLTEQAYTFLDRARQQDGTTDKSGVFNTGTYEVNQDSNGDAIYNQMKSGVTRPTTQIILQAGMTIDQIAETVAAASNGTIDAPSFKAAIVRAIINGGYSMVYGVDQPTEFNIAQYILSGEYMYEDGQNAEEVAHMMLQKMQDNYASYSKGQKNFKNDLMKASFITQTAKYDTDKQMLSGVLDKAPQIMAGSPITCFSEYDLFAAQNPSPSEATIYTIGPDGRLTFQ